MEIKKNIIVGYERILYFVCSECLPESELLVECHDITMLTNKKIDVLVSSKLNPAEQGLACIASFDGSTKHLVVLQSRIQKLKNAEAFQIVLARFAHHFSDIAFSAEFTLRNYRKKCSRFGKCRYLLYQGDGLRNNTNALTGW